jgi:hypothetical protein
MLTFLTAWTMCGLVATFCMSRVFHNNRAREEAQRRMK